MSADDPERDTDAEVERLFALVRERYGDRLTPAQLDEVKKGVEGVMKAARALRAVKLEPSDGPFPPFTPYRAGP
ncbi:MAG TPA: hypothetical protein VMS64_00020 [Candidatus Methylomirabilis sp.]|nr:hypothetical protein [Candidatus Methylomirabilis sp.]